MSPTIRWVETHLRGVRRAVLAMVGVMWVGCLAVPALVVLDEPAAVRRWLGIGSLITLAAAYSALVHDVARRPTHHAGTVFRARRRRPPLVFAAAVVLSLPAIAPLGADGRYTWAWIGGAVAGTAPMLYHGRIGWVSVVGTVGVAVVAGAFTGGNPAVHGLIAASVAAILVAASVLPLWLWDLLLLARTARDTQAWLVVTNERLRFARDLHDVLGHRLTLIALKAELTARLSEKAPAEAARHANDVQMMASTALTEVREAVYGYRTIGLAQQLAATVSTLRDAGVECSVSGRDAELSSASDNMFALVLREASTNILRHSTAQWCTIDLSLNTRESRMTIANNGARPEAANDRSSGLQGLAERLASLNGTMGTDRKGDVFTLTVTLPAQ